MEIKKVSGLKPAFNGATLSGNSMWENLYDRYGAVMYGIILEIIGDAVTTEIIFKKAFGKLENINFPKNNSISFYLWKHAGLEALNYLALQSDAESASKYTAFFSNASVIRSLCFSTAPLDKQLKKTNSLQSDLQRTLRTELSEIKTF